ncbi:MAG: protein-disulfide reductase DsbD family protein [Gemmataceae bacterium]
MSRVAALSALLFSTAVVAQPPKKDAWFDKAVKSIDLAFDPAEAKPGQTVTLRLTVTLADGYYTYPAAQPDKAAKDMVNELKFPDPGPVVFVGSVLEPREFNKKAEPILGIKELRTLSGKVVYERKLVVNPAQPAGPVAVKLPAVKLNVCDEKICYPTKTVTPSGTLKVFPGPAVAIDPAVAAEVKKALGGM